ncbi:hypothetical protein COY90_02490 [Candidatus Roizmanbacteria bacterium CG_4_10_14_0_8_um_filter_39_9]|uniref:Cupin type-2 domain-containing protein n=1 Tax=Candidatus Roizmanbacteria bacterium CG_4_10_14_0_8_um_filter_39_9 TaxID=1974829 RepID=A0A2M7QDZ8_9BACT|nr:MAG: hypothetical protein COY90_02490 [Candidatus Roizmanbacteria bacterium CG_4_10_14_0_8_um_filter_39_9]
MRINEVIDELKKTYPGKKILLNSKDNLTEILCEIEPASLHPDYSVAVAVIDESVPHYHTNTTETYEVLRGALDLTIGDTTIHLKQGGTCTIQPEELHKATGSETWVKVTSKPGWIPQDHRKVKEKNI